eukprot:277427_1
MDTAVDHWNGWHTQKLNCRFVSHPIQATDHPGVTCHVGLINEDFKWEHRTLKECASPNGAWPSIEAIYELINAGFKGKHQDQDQDQLRTTKHRTEATDGTETASSKWPNIRNDCSLVHFVNGRIGMLMSN